MPGSWLIRKRLNLALIFSRIVNHKIFEMAYSKLPNKYKPVTHCIFDMDGLLVDSESVDEDIITQIAQAYNKPYPIEVRLKLLGTTEKRTAVILVSELGLPITPDEFMRQFREQCKEKYARCDLMSG